MFSQIMDEPRIIRLTRKFAIAASVLVIIGSASLIFYTYTSGKRKDSEPQIARTKIAPEKIEGVSLTLANGSTIPLEMVNAGPVASQGSAIIHKQPDGQLTYQHQNRESQEILFNTISVPKGSKVQSIRLSDGTIAWLNMESTMHFPVSFSGKQREVEITGEVYFEVSPDAARKFVVRTETSSTEVLGTHFNVNTYGQPVVTLLEGKVKFAGNGSEQLLAPCQQARLHPGSKKIHLDKSPDLEAVMAWKSGLFKLNNANVPTIMEQLSRWYDIDVNMGPGLNDVRFSGMMERKKDLAAVLEILSLTREVRFEKNGKSLTVLANTRIAN
jgi:hypothetical protein